MKEASKVWVTYNIDNHKADWIGEAREMSFRNRFIDEWDG